MMIGVQAFSLVIVFFICCCSASHHQKDPPRKNNSFARKNSKISRDFQNLKLFKENVTSWEKYFHKLVMETNKTEETNDIPDEDFGFKIVNGRPANEGQYPWMVALHFNGRFICSSFLISPSLVMTAAHCVEFEDGVEPASSFFGIIGNTRREGPETRITFREVAAHPSYGRGSEGDIAVLRTTTEVDMVSHKIEQICLPTRNRAIELVYIQAMGWGAQSNGNPDVPEELMSTELNVPPRSSCKFFFALSGITITDKHICASSFKPTGVCYGDSGGPGVYDDPRTGRPVAIGVASFITFLGCGRPVIPSVYTRVASYVDWLEDTVVDTSDICFA